MPGQDLRKKIGSAGTVVDRLSATTIYGFQSTPAKVRIAQKATTPLAKLTLLADDPALAVRQAVAQNPRTPIAILAAMSTDPELHLALAHNTGLPLALFTTLVQTLTKGPAHRDLFTALLAHPVCPPATAETLRVQFPHWRPQSRAQHPRTSRSTSLDLAKAQDPATDPAQVAIYAKSGNATIRLAVAQNPSTPLVTLQRLARDRFSRDGGTTFPIQEAVHRHPAMLAHRSQET